MRRKVCLCLGLAIVVFLASCGALVGATGLTIDGTQTYQTIDGFGVNANHRSWHQNDLKPVLDALIDEAGMTLFRVVFDKADWEATNDNGDSNVMNWDYYGQVYTNSDFQKMWDMGRYLNGRGITNGLMLNFQGNGPDWMGGSPLTAGYEAEWAEMVASLFIYARNNQHLQFNLVAPNNEPDILVQGVDMTSDQYVTALHTLSDLLDTNGLSDLRFVGPDLGYTSTDWLSAMMADPVVMGKVAHFGLHSYQDEAGGSYGAYWFLQQSAYPDRSVWMTEFNAPCGGCEAGVGGDDSWDYASSSARYLIYHLAYGASAGLVWEGYDSQYNYYAPGQWSYWGLFGVDDIYSAHKKYTPRKSFYAQAQISKFIRPGAQQIDVKPWVPPQAIAFYHTGSGQLTLVGVNTSSTPDTLSGVLTNLPPVASFDLYYTDSSTNLCHAGTFAVSDGAFTIPLPADCVYTVVGFDPARIAVSVALTNPPDGVVFAAPANIDLQASANTTTGSISQVEFFCGGTNIGEAVSPPYSITWSNVLPGTYLLSCSATNTLGEYGVSSGVRVVVVGPAVGITVTPSDATVSPQGTQQFAATVVDALGTPVISQPAFDWAVSGGGTIDTNGLFAADASAGGPFTVTATAFGFTGTASISVVSNLNLALTGVGYTWYGLAASIDNSPQALAPDINDDDLLTDVPLSPGGVEENSQAYEAAGVVWPTAQTISRVVYCNGSYNANYDGVFAAQFGLQFSFDGVTWTNADAAWTLTPAYSYNSPISADTSFTFSGSIATVRGVRCVGLVHTAETGQNSWVAVATEVQAFAAVPSGPAAQIVITPTNATAMPYGSQQFTAIATDASGNVVTSQPAFSWSVSGGGVIDSSGLFTAGDNVGGPFTITASATGLTATASISVSTNLNLAPGGLGYTWYSLTTRPGVSPATPTPGLTDGDLDTDVPLFPGGAEDVTNAYEAAGVVWDVSHTINRVTYYNGSYTTEEDGVFAANFGLQFSFDGQTWTNAGASWAVSPAYVYNSPASANTNFTFTGSAVTVRGVRCVGRVHTRKASSWVANATELQAFAAPLQPIGPSVSVQPTNQTALAGTTAAFSVGAGGSPFLSYQWCFNGTNLNGAAADTLWLTNVQPQQAGSYSVVVTNAGGSTTSSVATLTVLAPPVITLQPTNQTALPGATACFSVAATGAEPLSYQWLFNGTNVDGAIADTFCLTNVQLAQAGSYNVLVTNIAGATTSTVATLTFGAPPLITQQPTNQAALPGATVSFSVAAIGTEPLTYQWQFNGTNISGAVGQTLWLSNVQPAEVGGYAAQVSNPAGTTNSAVALLSMRHYPLLLDPRTTAEGAFAFTMQADTGGSYVVEVSTNFVEWAPLSTLSNVLEHTDFTDSTSSNSTSRFYRARLAD